MVQRSTGLSECTSGDQTSELSEGSNALLKFTRSEVMVHVDSNSNVEPLIQGQTW